MRRIYSVTDAVYCGSVKTFSWNLSVLSGSVGSSSSVLQRTLANVCLRMFRSCSVKHGMHVKHAEVFSFARFVEVSRTSSEARATLTRLVVKAIAKLLVPELQSDQARERRTQTAARHRLLHQGTRKQVNVCDVTEK